MQGAEKNLELRKLSGLSHERGDSIPFTFGGQMPQISVKEFGELLFWRLCALGKKHGASFLRRGMY